MTTREEHTKEIVRWQGDGGGDLGEKTETQLRRDPGDGPGAYGMAKPSHLPALPDGYHVQSAGGFSDPAGRRSYEFHRVYGPPKPTKNLGAIAALDQALSYWVTTTPEQKDVVAPAPVGRWLSFARARQLRGSRLSFEHFSSLSSMRAELPALLDQGEPSDSPTESSDISNP